MVIVYLDELNRFDMRIVKYGPTSAELFGLWRLVITRYQVRYQRVIRPFAACTYIEMR